MGSVAEAQSQTQANLNEAVQQLKLPASVMGLAAQLQSRLNQPTRVCLLGLPKSGKTGVFNLLAGQDVLPEGLGSTVNLVYGAEPKAHVTLPEGTTLTLEGVPDLERIGAMTPVFVKLEMDLPALKKISLLETVTGNDQASQQRAMAWALKQTDIAIWCTEDFTAPEQALWASAPDAIKDHAILVRTRADAIAGDRKAAAQALEGALDDSFAYYMAVSTHEARAARAAPELDKAAMKASGATSLISTILRQIERGRQAAVDQADILLMKHAREGEASAEAKAEALKAEAQPDAVIEEAVPVEPEVAAVEPVAEAVMPKRVKAAPAELSVNAPTIVEPELDGTSVNAPQIVEPESAETVAAEAMSAPEGPVSGTPETAAPETGTGEDFVAEADDGDLSISPADLDAGASARVAEPARDDQTAPLTEEDVSEPNRAVMSDVAKALASDPASDPASQPVADAPAADAGAAAKEGPVPGASGKTADDFAFVSSMSAAAKASATVPMATLFDQTAPASKAPSSDDIVVRTLETAVQRLVDTGEAIATFDPQNSRKVLRAVSKTLDWLNMHLMDPELPDEEAFDAIRDMAQDATDLVQLLKAESNEDGSIEAVTALLQIKRGLQAELAA